ncbi:MAG: hypothetical protein Q9211_003533 [Gyalolechia sp. 1 TL-2023]
MTVAPRIIAQANLPALCSFSSEEAPVLRLILTLTSSSSTIKIPRYASPFWPVVNALSIINLQTHEVVQLPRIDINFRSAAAEGDKEPSVVSSSATTKAQDEDYITLQPDVPYTISLGFRPFGHELYDSERLKGLGSDKYKIATTLGMHLLQAGVEYEISVREGMKLGSWIEDTPSGQDEAAERDPIPIDIVNSVKFHVEA